MLSEHSLGAGQLTNTHRGHISDISNPVLFPGTLVSSQNYLQQQLNAHSGHGVNPQQPVSMLSEHSLGAGQLSSTPREHVSEISNLVPFPGTQVSSQSSLQRPVNAHSGHGVNPKQPVSMLSEHSLGAGQLSSTPRGHVSDISNPVPLPGKNVNSQNSLQRPVNAHSGHGVNPQQPVSMLSEHSLGAGQLLSTHRGHVSDISNPVPFPGTHVSSQNSLQRPVNAHSGHGVNPHQPVSMLSEHSLGAGQLSSTPRGHVFDISNPVAFPGTHVSSQNGLQRLVNAHSGHGVNPQQPVSMLSEHSLGAGQLSSTPGGDVSDILNPVLLPGINVNSQNSLQRPVNAHSGHGVNPQQPVSMLSEHSLGGGQLSSTPGGYVSDISNPFPFPGTNVNSQNSLQRPVNAHSGHGVNPQQPGSVLSEHSLGAGQLSSTLRGHGVDISNPAPFSGTNVSSQNSLQRPVNAHSWHGVNPQQPLSLQSEHSLSAGQQLSAHRGHVSDILNPNPLTGIYVISQDILQQPVNAHSLHGVNSQNSLQHAGNTHSGRGQHSSAHRGHSADSSQQLNAYSGHGVNMLTYEAEQKVLRKRLTKMEIDNHGLMQRLSQIEQENRNYINHIFTNPSLHMNYPVPRINYSVNLGYMGYGMHQNLISAPASMIPAQPRPILMQNCTGQSLNGPTNSTSRTTISQNKMKNDATSLPNNARSDGMRPSDGNRNPEFPTSSPNAHSGQMRQSKNPPVTSNKDSIHSLNGVENDNTCNQLVIDLCIPESPGSASPHKVDESARSEPKQVESTPIQSTQDLMNVAETTPGILTNSNGQTKVDSPSSSNPEVNLPEKAVNDTKGPAPFLETGRASEATAIQMQVLESRLSMLRI